MSDIHYEIDMSTLGCNSKVLWHDIFIQLLDSISLKHSAIILCKCFHEINQELLDIFYSYFQRLNNKMCYNVDIRYILLTEHISFIPDNLLKWCEIISVPRPTLNRYNKCLSNSSGTTILNISNHFDIPITFNPYECLCKNIIGLLRDNKHFKFIKTRDYIYEMLVYN